MQPLANPKHEAFAYGMATGKTLAAALADAGYKPHPPSGARLLKNAKISERIDFIKAKVAKDREEAVQALTQKEALTRQWVIDNLMKNVKICMGLEQTPDGHVPAGANKALELLGQELGMFIKRTEQGKPGEFAELDELTDTDLADIARASSSRAFAPKDGTAWSSGVH